MKNTEQFYNHVTGFIDEVSEAVAKYDSTVKRLEPYKGSSGYDQQIKEAQDARNADVRGIREIYWPAFQKITAGMREAVKNRPIVSPTAEQAALLSVMQMRKTLSRDELERASKQLSGCTMALAVLDDLAEKHKAKGEPFNTELSADQLLDKINGLERAANRLICGGYPGGSEEKAGNRGGLRGGIRRFWADSQAWSGTLWRSDKCRPSAEHGSNQRFL